MTTYSLWTLTRIGEMDRRIMSDIETADEAREWAASEADDRDTEILIMDEETGLDVDVVFPPMIGGDE